MLLVSFQVLHTVTKTQFMFEAVQIVKNRAQTNHMVPYL